jgi:hypothetical protein
LFVLHNRSTIEEKEGGALISLYKRKTGLVFNSAPVVKAEAHRSWVVLCVSLHLIPFINFSTHKREKTETSGQIVRRWAPYINGGKSAPQ